MCVAEARAVGTNGPPSSRAAMSLPGAVVAVRELFAGFSGASLKWQHIRFWLTEGSRDLLGH